MPAPIDRQTLAVFVRTLEAALGYAWIPGPTPAAQVEAERRIAACVVAWGRALCAAPDEPAA